MTETKPTIDQLLAAEVQLDRSFLVSVVLLLLNVGWPVFLRLAGHSASWAGGVAVVLSLLLLGAYVWFIVSVTRAAKRLGTNWIPFLAWMVLSPLFLCLPIPFLGQVIAASPLSLKFLLSGQLRTEIHDRTFAEDA